MAIATGRNNKKKNNANGKTEEKTFFAPRQQSRPVWALVLACIGLLMLVAMVGYEPAQSSQNAVGVDVAGNPVGQYGADFCANAYKVFGRVAWVLPLLFLWTAALLFFKRAQKVRWLFLLAVIGLLVSLCGVFTMAEKTSAANSAQLEARPGMQWDVDTTPPPSSELPFGGGGSLGQWSYNDLFIRYIGPFGNGLILVIILVLSVSLLFPGPLVLFWRYLHGQWLAWAAARRVRKEMIREARAKIAAEREKQKILAKEARRAQKTSGLPVDSVAALPRGGQGGAGQGAAGQGAPSQGAGRAAGSAASTAAAAGGFERGADSFPAEAPRKRGLFARLFGGQPRAAKAELIERPLPAAAASAQQPAGDNAAASAAAFAAAAPDALVAKRIQAKSAPSVLPAEQGIRLSKNDPFAVELDDSDLSGTAPAAASTSSAPASAAATGVTGAGVVKDLDAAGPTGAPAAPAASAAASAAEEPPAATEPPASLAAAASVPPVAAVSAVAASATAPVAASVPPVVAAVPAAAAALAAGGLKVVAVEKTEKASAARPERRGDYIFPSIDLLSEPPADDGADDSQDYGQMMDLLIETLDQFNVKVEKEQVTTGPVITRYEVKPAPGVRVEKILSLDKNLALSLMADSVRILAPVPGRGTVGIEIPNKKPKAVCMREIVESRAWADSKAEIPVVLGKDVTGRPIVEDLTKMPHMLIAGSTGSGKTVCINAIIASLLYHAGPEDLRFIMVDPKVVEMQVYNALPHMLIPVVTDPKKVPGALKYLLNEMERRYRVFAKVGVRNIAGFNKKLAKDKAEREKLEAMEREQAASLSMEERVAAAEIEVPRDDDVLEVPTKKFPYIVCIIDELADLMMVAPQDIETGVARLAQLARAAGIHLILATQRPSVNVITGVIKANLPTRIAFKVASKVDSRTILDQMGADALIGKGDMLFIPPGTSNLVRAQGAFVSDEEINGIVEYLSEKNGEPEYAEEVQAEIEAGGEDGSGGGAEGEYDDELVPQAIEIIRTHQRASTSFLQRKLKIGYNRAARIMDILEEEGIVGPDNGPSAPREIMD